MAYMTPDEIARQHAAFFGSYVGFLVVSSAAGLLLAFFHQIRALMKYPLCALLWNQKTSLPGKKTMEALAYEIYQGGRRFDEGA